MPLESQSSDKIPQAHCVAGPALLEGTGIVPDHSGGPVAFPPAVDNPGWVDVRCSGIIRGESCDKLLLRICGETTIEGVHKSVKIGLDMKCRRCKEINYRVIVV